MATVFTVELTSSDNTNTAIEITVASGIGIGIDTWKADSASWFGHKAGKVSSWGTGNAILAMATGVGTITLDGFKQSTTKNDSGTGSKLTTDGDFPEGALEWLCTKKA